jgi:hypothetical protein
VFESNSENFTAFNGSENESSWRSNSFSEKLGNVGPAADRVEADRNQTSTGIFMAGKCDV